MRINRIQTVSFSEQPTALQYIKSFVLQDKVKLDFLSQKKLVKKFMYIFLLL